MANETKEILTNSCVKSTVILGCTLCMVAATLAVGLYEKRKKRIAEFTKEEA